MELGNPNGISSPGKVDTGRLMKRGEGPMFGDRWDRSSDEAAVMAVERRFPHGKTKE